MDKTGWTIRDLPPWENFLRQIRASKGSSWWLARDAVRETSLEDLLSYYHPKDPVKTLGRLLANSVGVWTRELRVEGKGGGNRAKGWRVVTLDEVLGYPLSP